MKEINNKDSEMAIERFADEIEKNQCLEIKKT